MMSAMAILQQLSTENNIRHVAEQGRTANSNVGDTTPESRKNWIAALDRLAALNPTMVVAGHKKPGKLGDRRDVHVIFGVLSSLPD
jgi:hypothetical protein